MKKIKNTIIYLGSCLLLMVCKVNNVYAADCDGIFGDPGDSESLAYLIKGVLEIFRIAAPVLVIVFGSLDLFRAVIASSEDQMKKAQAALLKRVMLGVCLFFVPTFIYFIIDIANQALLNIDSCMYRW